MTADNPGDQPASLAASMAGWMLGMVARAYAIGPDAAGGAVFAEWMSDIPGDTTWDGAEVHATACRMASVLVTLCFEIDAGQAEGRPVDVAGFLDRQQMVVVLADAARAEGVTAQEILDRVMSQVGGPGPDRPR